MKLLSYQSLNNNVLNIVRVAGGVMTSGDNGAVLTKPNIYYLSSQNRRFNMIEQKKKYHFIYKIINNVNGKIYIGKHTTYNLNDGYMGSGIYLSNAIKKYGLENFTREILEFFETSEDAFKREKEIVTEEFIKRSDTYNMKLGGDGGFTSEDNKYFWSIKSPEERKAMTRGLDYSSEKQSERSRKWNNSEDGKRLNCQLMTNYNKSEQGRNTSRKMAAHMRDLIRNYKISNPEKYNLLDLKRRLGSCHRNHVYYKHSENIWECPKCRDKFISLFESIKLLDNEYLINKYGDKYEIVK